MWGSAKNGKIIGFFNIFWDILDKRIVNLGQERVKSGLLFFQGRIRTIAPDFPDSFSSFGPTFPPGFGLTNNRAIC